MTSPGPGGASFLRNRRPGRGARFDHVPPWGAESGTANRALADATCTTVQSMSSKKSGYRNYTADSTYWTVRKYNGGYWVVRIDNSSNNYEWAEVFGGYDTAGAAGGVAAQLGYAQGRRDALEEAANALHLSLIHI